MTFRKSAALAGGAILALAFAASSSWAADYSTAKLPAPVGKVEAAKGASITRSDKALAALIAPGAKVEKLASGFVFVEGPAWRKGEMWFSEQRGTKVWS